MATRRHWHVMAGTVGCMPELAEIYDTRRDAVAAAQEEVNQYRGAGRRVAGSISRDWVVSVDPINYVELYPCADPDCQPEE